MAFVRAFLIGCLSILSQPISRQCSEPISESYFPLPTHVCFQSRHDPDAWRKSANAHLGIKQSHWQTSHLYFSCKQYGVYVRTTQNRNNNKPILEEIIDHDDKLLNVISY